MKKSEKFKGSRCEKFLGKFTSQPLGEAFEKRDVLKLFLKIPGLLSEISFSKRDKFHPSDAVSVLTSILSYLNKLPNGITFFTLKYTNVYQICILHLISFKNFHLN